jgi:hypothetical protein
MITSSHQLIYLSFTSLIYPVGAINKPQQPYSMHERKSAKQELHIVLLCYSNIITLSPPIESNSNQEPKNVV